MWLLTIFFCVSIFFPFHLVLWLSWNNSETPVVEKEVVEVDAPKVVDEENEVVENGNGEEAAAAEPAAAATEENGTTEETTEEVTSAEEVDVQNGDSTGKWKI